MKAKLGQFYTVHYEYILQNMIIPDLPIIEPFVGNGDLLKFVKANTDKIEMYDIDPKIPCVKRDTLLDPPDYKGKFVLTNPPYLARNKNTDKTVYDKYKCNDLYKCFLMTLIANKCAGGIIIVPLNFISSIRKADINLRKTFLDEFEIKTINIFEERVFDDTSYTVCSLQFAPRDKQELTKVYIYPSKKIMDVSLTSKTPTIGGEIFELPIKYKVQRATENNVAGITNILVKCIDDSDKNLLGFSIVKDEDRFIDKTAKSSARSYATLLIDKTLTIPEQEELVKKMNNYLMEQREKYNSLFLPNYRESTTIARKRIPFSLAFRIAGHFI